MVGSVTLDSFRGLVSFGRRLVFADWPRWGGNAWGDRLRFGCRQYDRYHIGALGDLFGFAYVHDDAPDPGSNRSV